LVPWRRRHFITADPDFRNEPEGAGRNAGVPLMLTGKGKRANIQNEKVGGNTMQQRRIAGGGRSSAGTLMALRDFGTRRVYES
jgi:hypothetical protein